MEPVDPPVLFQCVWLFDGCLGGNMSPGNMEEVQCWSHWNVGFPAECWAVSLCPPSSSWERTSGAVRFRVEYGQNEQGTDWKEEKTLERAREQCHCVLLSRLGLWNSNGHLPCFYLRRCLLTHGRFLHLLFIPLWRNQMEGKKLNPPWSIFDSFFLPFSCLFIHPAASPHPSVPGQHFGTPKLVSTYQSPGRRAPIFGSEFSHFRTLTLALYLRFHGSQVSSPPLVPALVLGPNGAGGGAGSEGIRR